MKNEIISSFTSESRSVMSNSLHPHGLYSPWNSPDQNAGLDSLFLLQVIFPTQGSTAGLPHCRWILYQLSHKKDELKWNGNERDIQPPILNTCHIRQQIICACWSWEKTIKIDVITEWGLEMHLIHVSLGNSMWLVIHHFY